MSDGGDSPWLKTEPWGLTPRVMARLEQEALEVAADWGLELGPRIVAGRYSYVAPAGDEAILKVAPAEDDMVTAQADALRVWNGDGAIRLLREDRDRHAMLLERAYPGDDLSSVGRAEALVVAVGTALRIWRPMSRGGAFRWIGDHVPRWLDEAGDHEPVRYAKGLYRSLQVRDDDVLLHGDYHHHNLIRRGDAWVVIDPQPITGEREFDVPTLFWNPIGHVPTRESIDETIAAFANAGLDAERIRLWGIVRGALQGFPLSQGETEETSPQARTVRLLR